MEITVESQEEFERLCRKVVFEEMPKLPTKSDNDMVAVMMRLFDIGVEFGKNKVVKVEI